jgi:hypothetical protein
VPWLYVTSITTPGAKTGTRLILATYAVGSVRMMRLMKKGESDEEGKRMMMMQIMRIACRF